MFLQGTLTMFFGSGQKRYSVDWASIIPKATDMCHSEMNTSLCTRKCHWQLGVVPKSDESTKDWILMGVETVQMKHLVSVALWVSFSQLGG